MLENEKRNLVFVSHANPEDNEFTSWLVLKLANEGYRVWCDLINLIAGETFWDDIETAIREYSIKFIFVLSKTSNVKEGSKDELHIAKTVAQIQEIKDFIIPVKIDDIDYENTNVALHRKTVIDFTLGGWARGLNKLVEKFEKDKVPKDKDKFSPNSVNEWWKTQFSSEKKILDKPEEYLSNLFEFKLPEQIYFHKIKDYIIADRTKMSVLPYPTVEHSNYIITFASSKDLVVEGKSYFESSRSFAVNTSELIEGKYFPEIISDEKTARNLIIQLIRISWESFIKTKGLLTYGMSNGKKAFYGTDKIFGAKRLSFDSIDGRISKSLVGYKTIKKLNGLKAKRFWHFAISTKTILWPMFGFFIKGHVAFSEDGNNVWENSDRMHSARRKQCKDWWNDDWKDRILCIINWLKNSEGLIKVEVGFNKHIEVSSWPQIFNCPVSYKEPETRHIFDLYGSYEEDVESEEIEKDDKQQ